MKKNQKPKFSPIKWTPKEVEVRKIKPTPKNYKIASDLGKQRLAKSLELFGIAGTVVVNTDLTLIDGNSRLEQAKERGEKKVWVSVPNRKLTRKEFEMMSAMYDFAVAGDVDEEGIKRDLGTHEDFYKMWGMQVPAGLLDKMGAKSKGPKISVSESKGGKIVADSPVDDTRKVELFFTVKEESLFRKLEDKLAKKFKSIGTTDTVLRAFKQLAK